MTALQTHLHDDPHWNRAQELLQRWTDEDRLPAAAVCVGTAEESVGPLCFGRPRIDDSQPRLTPDHLFLVASITKPLVAMAVLKLVEQGELLLGTRVTEIIPEFGHQGTYGVTIRHLLTHSSGLPDMLPDNWELRQQQSPLSRFVEGTCQVDVEFPTGRNAAYSSMGFALLGEIIHRVSGLSARDFLRREFFEPLGMRDTTLGAPDAWFDETPARIDRVVDIRVPENMRGGTDWNWNSRYWRSLGAPWGGLITSPQDLGRYARMLLNGGWLGGERVLSPAAVAAATRNQIEPLRDIPETVRRTKAWGLGWRLHWPAHSANFGDLLGPRTYGHWGATGTLLWIDPDAQRWCVILTTEPQEPDGTWIARLSNVIAAAIV